jgi:hypothetical protein
MHQDDVLFNHHVVECQELIGYDKTCQAVNESQGLGRLICFAHASDVKTPEIKGELGDTDLMVQEYPLNLLYFPRIYQFREEKGHEV